MFAFLCRFFPAATSCLPREPASSGVKGVRADFENPRTTPRGDPGIFFFPEPFNILPRDIYQDERCGIQLSLPRYRGTNSETDPDQLIKIKATPNKGDGTFAKIDIARGTRILSENRLMPVETNSREIITKFQALSPGEKFVYMGLAEYKGPDVRRPPREKRDGEERKVLALYQGNNLGDGIFKWRSRINHSCIPNVQFAYNERINKWTTHAVRDISAGEELTVNYLSSVIPQYNVNICYSLSGDSCVVVPCAKKQRRATRRKKSGRSSSGSSQQSNCWNRPRPKSTGREQ